MNIAKKVLKVARFVGLVQALAITPAIISHVNDGDTGGGKVSAQFAPGGAIWGVVYYNPYHHACFSGGTLYCRF